MIWAEKIDGRESGRKARQIRAVGAASLVCRRALRTKASRRVGPRTRHEGMAGQAGRAGTGRWPVEAVRWALLWALLWAVMRAVMARLKPDVVSRVWRVMIVGLQSQSATGRLSRPGAGEPIVAGIRRPDSRRCQSAAAIQIACPDCMEEPGETITRWRYCCSGRW